ncbi:GWxTD domain-containing protein [Balneola sp. MJW-20]|uniref:GWxTD domain-containing protein n=1 Tax=Gracilimonas aurantiaca TaxID=3234185 RepID=UPI00346557BC
MRYLLTILLSAILSTVICAQRVSYPQLVNRNQIPQVYIDEIVIPDSSGLHTLVFSFKFQNEFIPFKKIPVEPDFMVPEGKEYYAIMRLNSEIFKGVPGRNRNIEPVSRDTWTDTLFAENFDETRSRDLYASGSLKVQLRPGVYNYILQLNTQDASRDRNTQPQRVRIPDLSKKEMGEIYLINNDSEANPSRLTLISKNNNVPYGEDFLSLIRIPDLNREAIYTLKVDKIRIQERDTSMIEEVYTNTLDLNELMTNRSIQFVGGKESALSLREGGTFNYLLVKIPNNEFENAAYRLTVNSDKRNKPVASRVFRSLWDDMPASLYNLDIAIDNMKYIVSEDQIRSLKKGNDQEKEKKFREFWDQRDPSPGTVYNELMAEYYRRIDYAFKTFGTRQFPLGHETDMGEIYIKYGPPNNKERVFPTNGNTRETWFYDNRKFVFEAVSGFGDFELVATQ